MNLDNDDSIIKNAGVSLANQYAFVVRFGTKLLEHYRASSCPASSPVITCPNQSGNKARTLYRLVKQYHPRPRVKG